MEHPYLKALRLLSIKSFFETLQLHRGAQKKKLLRVFSQPNSSAFRAALQTNEVPPSEGRINPGNSYSNFGAGYAVS